MSDNSSRIPRSNILAPLAEAVERERRLTKAGESFDQRHKETIEHDRDELRRSGIVAPNWQPNDTNAGHGFWDAWSKRIRKAAGELAAAGETAIAGQLLSFCGQIDDRDEVTGVSDFRFEKLAEWLAEHFQAGGPPRGVQTPKKPKGSTQRGGGEAKLIAALTKHHDYADGGCLNLEPIVSNELARGASVSKSTASTFFKKKFGGYTKYRALCRDATRLIASLKLLNQEFSPHHLFGRKPPNEDDRDNEE